MLSLHNHKSPNQPALQNLQYTEGFYNIHPLSPNFSSHLTQLNNFHIVLKEPKKIFFFLCFAVFKSGWVFWPAIWDPSCPPCIFRSALVYLLGPILPAASLGPLPRASSFSHFVQIRPDSTALNDILVLNGLGHHSSSVGTQRGPGKGLKCRAEIWKDVRE